MVKLNKKLYYGMFVDFDRFLWYHSINMRREVMLFEGKDKVVYSFKKGLLLLEFKKTTDGKSDLGILRSNLSEYLFSKIAKINIDTHFVKRNEARSLLVQEANVFPITFRIRNRITADLGSIFRRNVGDMLDPPVIDYFFHQQGSAKRLIPKEYIELSEIIDNEDLDEIEEQSFRINDFLLGLFAAFDLELWCLDLRWGRCFDPKEDAERLLICDEMSAENFFLYDSNSNKIVTQFAENNEENKALAKKLKMMLRFGEE